MFSDVGFVTLCCCAPSLHWHIPVTVKEKRHSFGKHSFDSIHKTSSYPKSNSTHNISCDHVTDMKLVCLYAIWFRLSVSLCPTPLLLPVIKYHLCHFPSSLVGQKSSTTPSTPTLSANSSLTISSRRDRIYALTCKLTADLSVLMCARPCVCYCVLACVAQARVLLCVGRSWVRTEIFMACAEGDVRLLSSK